VQFQVGSSCVGSIPTRGGFFYFILIYYSNMKILRLLPSENMSIFACAKAKEAGSVAVSTCIEKDLICQQIKQMVLTRGST